MQSVVANSWPLAQASGVSQLHLDVDRGVLANRQADSRARFIGEPLFCRSNLEAPRRQAGRLIVPPAVGCDRARCTCVDVPDCHRDIAKGCAGLVRHHAGKARSRLGPRRERPIASHKSSKKNLQTVSSLRIAIAYVILLNE